MDVHVLAAAEGLPRTRQRTTSSGVTVHEVPVYPRLQFLTDFLINASRLRRLLRVLSPDLVHVQGHRPYPMAALEQGFPSVITVHGVIFEEAKLASGCIQRFRGSYACLAERHTMQKARHVICLNNYALESMGRYLRTDDVRLIDNAVDDRFFDLPDESEPGRVLFAGLIIDRKNVLGLLEAAKLAIAKYPGLKLRVAGHAIDPAYYDRCVAFVQRNGLSGSVEFLGGISADGIASELSRANMLVLPARQETSPMIISETMAAGKPVIATPVGGMPEVVKDGQTGFIVPLNDARGLADRIVAILSDAELRVRLGAAARRIASDRFRRAAVLEKTVAFYQDILRQEGRR